MSRWLVIIELVSRRQFCQSGKFSAIDGSET